jgi:hypothetical protein
MTLQACGGGGGNGSSNATIGNSAILAWYAPTTKADGTPLADLAGYKVYYGNSSHNYTQTVKIPLAVATCTAITNGTQCTFSITGLSSGMWYFAVTAYDTFGNESVYSNEGSKTIQ